MASARQKTLDLVERVRKQREEKNENTKNTVSTKESSDNSTSSVKKNNSEKNVSARQNTLDLVERVRKSSTQRKESAAGKPAVDTPKTSLPLDGYGFRVLQETQKQATANELVARTKTYPLKANNGMYFGEVSYDGMKAIQEGKINEYFPKSVDEATAFNRLKDHLKRLEKEERTNLNPVYQRYNIDPTDFKYNDLDKWAKEHNFYYSPNMDGKDLLVPKTEGGFLGIGATIIPTEQEREDAIILEQLARSNADGSYFDVAGATGASGLATFNKNLFDTLAFLLPTEYLPEGWDFIGAGQDFYTEQWEYYERERQKALDKVNAGAFAQFLSDLGVSTINAAPGAALAWASGGASLGASGASTLAGASAAASSGIGVTLSQIGQKALKNPQTYLTLLQTLGPEYEKAKSEGANEGQAIAYAFTSAGLGSLIEVSGGIQTLPDNLSKGGNVWGALAKSGLEEGTEEIHQRLVSGSAEKIIYNQDKEMFSLSNEDAIINPASLGKEFAMGVGVGWILGAPGTVSNVISNRVDRSRIADMGKKYTDNVVDVIESGLESAPGSEAHTIATQMLRKVETGEKISDYDLGLAVLTIDKEIRNEIFEAEDITDDITDDSFKPAEDLPTTLEEAAEGLVNDRTAEATEVIPEVSAKEDTLPTEVKAPLKTENTAVSDDAANIAESVGKLTNATRSIMRSKMAVGSVDGRSYVGDGIVSIPVSAEEATVAKSEWGAKDSTSIGTSTEEVVNSKYTPISTNPIKATLPGYGNVYVFEADNGQKVAISEKYAKHFDGYDLSATFTESGIPRAIKATDADGNLAGVVMAIKPDNNGIYNTSDEVKVSMKSFVPDTPITKIAPNVLSNEAHQAEVTSESAVRKMTGFGDYGARAFADVMNSMPGADTGKVQQSFRTAYATGLTGLNASQVSFVNEVQKVAFEAGQRDRIMEQNKKVENVKNVMSHGKNAGFEGSSSNTEQTNRLINKMYKAFGVKGGHAKLAANAEITGNIGIVNIADDFQNKIFDGKDLRKVTATYHAAHEVAMHRLMELAPIEGQAFIDALFKHMGIDAAGLAEAKRQAYAEQDVDISLSEAMEEVAANSILELYGYDEVLFEKALDRIIAENGTFAQKGLYKFKQVLNSVINWLKSKLGSMSASQKAEAEADIKKLEDLRNVLEKAMSAAVAKNKEIAKTNPVTVKDGVIVDSKGNVVAQLNEDGTATFSLRTYDEVGRAELKKWLDKNVKNKKLTEAEAKEISEQLEYYYDICKKYEDNYAPFSAWSKAEVVKGLDGKPLMSVVKANGEYKMNLDFSLVCKKRRPLDALYRAMIDDGFMDNIGQLSEVEVARINEIIRKHGFETACTLCFVDSKRYRQYAVADSFVSKYNELVKMLAPEGAKLDRFDFSGRRAASAEGLHTMSDAELKKGINKLNKVIKEHGETTVVGKIAKHLKAYPSDRKLVAVSDFMDSEGFVRVKKANPEVFKLYNSSKGSGGPKATLPDVQYLGEILKRSNFTPKKAYAVGGVRVQSFSDYIPRLVFDYLQMTADLSAKKLPAHAYSKEDIFVMQFGKTGIKINMSLVPAVAKDGIAPGLDKDGNYVWVDGHTFASDFHDKGSGQRGFELAVKIQNTEGYGENCGTVAVGVSDAHIEKMLADPDIRMVIPYHLSSLNHFVAKMGNIDQYHDYTPVQNTRDKATGKKIEGKDFSFNEAFHRLGDAKAATNEYLAWCEKNNYIPKFDHFAYHEDANVRDNYYKLLIDFSAYDSNGNATPQREVRMNFPTESDAFGSMTYLIEKGLEADAVLEGKKAAKIPEILNEVKSTLGVESAEKGQETSLAKALREAGTPIQKKFSMRESVEQTKDLIALHNASEEQLLDAIARSQFTMPSIAVTNNKFDTFGDISVVFHKNTIDPNVDANNKLYGSDAWTPQQTELKKNPKFDNKATNAALKGIRNNLGDLAPQLFNANIGRFQQNIAKADGSLFNAYAHNVGMQAAYAMENGLISSIPTDANGKVNTAKLQENLNAVLDVDSEWRAYKKWLGGISDSIITSYDRATNEDIFRTMKAQPDYAKKFRLGVNGELTAPVVEYSSIEDFKRNKGRLSENAEQDAALLGKEFLQWAKTIPGAKVQDVVKAINSTFDSRYSSKDIVKAFADKGITISSKNAETLQSLYQKAVELSTPYFEAKPQRGVGVNEIAAVVLPSNASSEIVSKLREAGINILTYKKGNSADRLNKVNSVENVKFSLRQEFASEIDAWDGKKNTIFKVGTTSEPLKSIGVQDRPIIWHGKKIAEILRKHKKMSRLIIKQVPRIMEHPIAVMKSQQSGSRITMFGDVNDEAGKPVLAILELQPTNKGGELLSMNVVASAYGKNTNLANFIQQSEVLYLDPNTKRTTTWLNAVGLQLPSVAFPHNGSVGTITYHNGNVNIKGVSYAQLLTTLRDSEYMSAVEKDIRYSLRGQNYSPLGVTEGIKQAVANKDADALSKYVERGIITTERYNQLIEEYGAIPKGEKAHREVEVPSKTEKDKKVSQTVRTILEAKATPDEAVPTIEKMVEDGVFSYDVYGDKKAIKDAEDYIQKYGWDESLDDWFDAVNKGEVSKETTTMGWMLYNNAANTAATTTDETERTTAIKTSLKILDAMVRHQRSAAQALQATRILKKMSPETQLYGVQKSVNAFQKELTEKYGDKAPDLKIDEALAEEFLKAKTDEERAEAEEKIYKDIGRQMPSRFIDKWNAWRYLAMLGNVKTHVRNIFGNAVFAPVVNVKNVIATGIESTVQKASGNKIGRSKALLNPKSKADKELVKAAYEDYANVADEISNGGKYSDFAMANQSIEEGRRIFKNKLLEGARKGNSALLEMEDTWFSKPHYAYALAMYCKANKITAEQLRNGKALGAARQYAIKEAQKATYRDTNAISHLLSGRLSEKGKFPKVAKAVNVVVDGILPFRKTPANILVRGVEYSPIGLLRGIKQAVWDVQRGNKTAAEAIDSISAGLTGTGLMALGMWLKSLDLIRGIGEDDDEEKEFKEMMGHQAYSLELPGGTSITLDWLAPEALPFFVGVNLAEAMEGEDKELNMSTILETMTGITAPMLEMSCLQGVNDMIEGFGFASANDTSGLVAFASSAATSYLLQVLPTIAGQAERTGEEYRMTTYTEKSSFLTKDMQYFFGKASAKIPIVDYNQIPYIDAWGRKEASGTALKRGFNNFLNPAYTSTIETSDMEKELLRLFEKTGDSSVFPERADKYFTIDGERKDLTADEYVRYATLKGEKSYKLVTDLVKSEDYKKLSDEEKAEAIANAYDYANQKAKQAIANYDPEKWVTVADKFGNNAGNFISFKTEVASTKRENDKISKYEVVDIISDMAQSDDEKWEMYLYMYDSKGAQYARNEGVSGESYLKYLDYLGDNTDGESIKQTDVVDAIQSLDIDSDDSWALYFSEYDSKGARHAYEEGVSGEDYIDFLDAIGDSKKKTEVVDAIQDLNLNSEKSWALYFSEFDDSGAQLAHKLGVPGDKYIDFRDNLDKVDEYYAKKKREEEGNPDDELKLGSYTQEEATIAIKSITGISNRDRAILWQSMNKNWKTKNNPWRSYLN